MKTVIVGYGRMGREIESILLKRGHEITARVDSAGLGDYAELNPEILNNCDGVIEFALPEGIEKRIELYARSGKPSVIGTTGWDSIAGKMKNTVINSGGSVMKGSNFSIGAHLFFRITSVASGMLNRIEQYDVSLTEYHHNKKADYPSGTAITAAEGIIKNLERKKRIIKDLPEGPIPPEALQVAAVRVGSVPGIHEMRMDSDADFLTIRHEARGRKGFAEGAVMALEWLNGKNGWFTAEQFMEELLA